MKMTTKGRYAVTAMLDLALQQNARPTPLSAIAERQGLSLSYLEQLFSALRRNGLVSSIRGPGGGYLLAEGPDAISISRIIKAVNEPMTGRRPRNEPCYLSQVWDELSMEIEQYLDSVSLSDVLANNEVRSIADRQQRIYINRHTEVA